MSVGTKVTTILKSNKKYGEDYITITFPIRS